MVGAKPKGELARWISSAVLTRPEAFRKSRHGASRRLCLIASRQLGGVPFAARTSPARYNDPQISTRGGCDTRERDGG